MTIYIIEGPAGAGKSTWIGQKFEPHQVVVRKNQDGVKRDYGGSAPVVSFDKDIDQLRRAFGEVYYANTAVRVIDRGWISQFVYESLRAGKFDKGLASRYWNSTKGLIHSMRDNFIHRHLRRESTGAQLWVEFIMYLPSYQALVDRRASSQKEYPFDPKDELDYYLQFTEVVYSHRNFFPVTVRRENAG